MDGGRLFKATKDDWMALATVEFFLFLLYTFTIFGIGIMIDGFGLILMPSKANPVDALIDMLVGFAQVSAVILFWSFLKFTDVALFRKYPSLRYIISIAPISAIFVIYLFFKVMIGPIGIVLITSFSFLVILIIFGTALVYMLWDAFFNYLKETSYKKNSQQQL